MFFSPSFFLIFGHPEARWATYIFTNQFYTLIKMFTSKQFLFKYELLQKKYPNISKALDISSNKLGLMIDVLVIYFNALLMVKLN